MRIGTGATGWRRLALACCALAATGAPGVPAQTPYKCIEQGVTVYSDGPCVSSRRASRGAPGEKLTQQQVLALVQAVDKTAARMDWAALDAYLADDVIIYMRMKSSRGPRRATIGKTEYRRLLDEGKEKIRNYSARREDVHVSVHPDGYRADVESRLTERWLDPGGAMQMTSVERWIVEPRGDRVRITMLDILSNEPQPQPRNAQ